MLTECIKQLGKSLTSTERKTLEDSFNGFVKGGMPEKEAGVAAVQDFHNSIKEQFADLYRASGAVSPVSKTQTLATIFPGGEFNALTYKKAQVYLNKLIKNADVSMSDVIQRLSDNGATLSTIRSARPYILKYLEDGSTQTTPRKTKAQIADEFEEAPALKSTPLKSEKAVEQKAESALVKNVKTLEQKSTSAKVESKNLVEQVERDADDIISTLETRPFAYKGYDNTKYELRRKGFDFAVYKDGKKERNVSRADAKSIISDVFRNPDAKKETLKMAAVEGFDSQAFEKEIDSIELSKDKTGKILALNGKPSNIQNERLAKTIRSKAFKDWFGDSKVVDENGEPQIYYHGTDQNIEAFRKGSNEPGIFFTDEPMIADEYAASAYAHSNVDPSNPANYPVFLKSKSPLMVDGKGEGWNFEGNFQKLKTAKSQGYDSVIMKNVIDAADSYLDINEDGQLIAENKPMQDEMPSTNVMVFDSTQIKSIFNRGSFSESDPSILKKLAEVTDAELLEASKQKLSPDFLSKIDIAQKGSRIKLATPETVELLRKAESAILGKDAKVSKGQFSVEQSQELADALDLYAETAREKGIDATPIENFRDAIVEAAKAGEGVVFYSDLPSKIHETGHQAGYKAAPVGAKDLMKRRGDVREYYTPDHIWKTALKSYNHYFKDAYFNGIDFDKLSYRQKAMLAEEMSVFAMTGDFAKIGLTLDEATTFLIYDWKAQIAVSGESVLDELIKYYSEFEFDASNLEVIRTEINEQQSNQNQAGKRSQSNTNDESQPQRPAESVTPTDEANTSGKRDDAKAGGERKRSLPETIRRAGLEAKDESYMVFRDVDAIEQAAEMLSDSGLDKTIDYLLKAEGYSKRDAVMSFQAQSVIQERAAELEEQGKFDESHVLKNKGLEIAHRHAQFATEAGQFIQASAILAKSRQAVLFRAAAIAEANGKELTAQQYDEFSALGENGVEVYTENKMLRQQIANLEKRLEDIQKEKQSVYKERVPRKHVAIARKHLGNHDALVQEARQMLRTYNETLKMAADVSRKEAIIEDIAERDPFIKAAAKIGASLMLDKPLHQIDRDNFTKELIGIFGEDAITSFELIFAEAFNLRRKLLADARKEAQAERLKDKAAEKAHESVLKRMKGSIAQKLANLYSPRVAAQKEDLIDVVFEMADSTEAAEMATRIILKDINLTEESRKNRKLVLEANQLIEQAQAQIITDKEQLKKEVLETTEQVQALKREELKQRQKIAEHNAAVAKALRRLAEHPIKFYTKEILKGIGEVRSVALSFDVGTILRQGFKYNFAEPMSLTKSLPALAKSFTEKGHLDVISKIEGHVDYHLWERMGVEFGFKTGEEQIHTEYFKKVPVLRQYLEFNERLFHSFLDAQRAFVAEAMVRRLRNKGITFENNPKAYKDIGYTINISTGKGQVKSASVQGAIDTVGTIYLAPKYAISRFQLLNEMTGPGLVKYSPEVRATILRQNLQTIGIAATITALVARALGEFISIDPEDDDFLKIRVGDKARYEFTGGLQSYIKLPLMYLKRGTMAFMGIKPQTNVSVIDKTESWLSYKLAPLPSYIYFGVKGKEVDGTPFHPLWSATRRAVPISIREGWEAYQMDGMPGVAMVLPTLAGVGTAYYKDREDKSDEKKQLKERIKLGELSKADAVKQLREDVKNGKITNRDMQSRIKSLDTSDITERIRSAKSTMQGDQKLYELVTELKPEEAQDAVDALARKAITARRDKSLKGREAAGIYGKYVKQISEKFGVKPRGAISKSTRMRMPRMARIKP